jgi:hypothetical protein
MEHHCRTVNLGDSRLRIRTEMNTTHNDVGAPEMTAKAWDGYLQGSGPGVHLGAVQFFLPRNGTQSVSGSFWTGQPQIHRDPFGRVWSGGLIHQGG